MAECIFCLVTIQNPKSKIQNHDKCGYFCSPCIFRWSRQSHECPLCRQPMCAIETEGGYISGSCTIILDPNRPLKKMFPADNDNDVDNSIAAILQDEQDHYEITSQNEHSIRRSRWFVNMDPNYEGPDKHDDQVEEVLDNLECLSFVPKYHTVEELKVTADYVTTSILALPEDCRRTIALIMRSWRVAYYKNRVGRRKCKNCGAFQHYTKDCIYNTRRVTGSKILARQKHELEQQRLRTEIQHIIERTLQYPLPV